MPDTGWLNLTSFTVWTNSSNAGASDDSYAADTSSSYFLPFLATNLGHIIPDGAVINGVEMRVERKASVVDGVKDLDIYLMYSGGTRGINKAVAGLSWPTSDAYYTYGGASDGWGASLTPAIVNSSTFGIYISPIAQGGIRTAYIDHVQLKIYYTLNLLETSAGFEELSIAATIPISDVAVGTDAILSNFIITISDSSIALDLINGTPNIVEYSQGLEDIVLEKRIFIEDGSVSSESIAYIDLKLIDEIITIIEEILITNSFTINDFGSGDDTPEVDFNFSSVVIRFTGSSAAIKFTGYREEVS